MSATHTSEPVYLAVGIPFGKMWHGDPPELKGSVLLGDDVYILTSKDYETWIWGLDAVNLAEMRYLAAATNNQDDLDERIDLLVMSGLLVLWSQTPDDYEHFDNLRIVHSGITLGCDNPDKPDVFTFASRDSGSTLLETNIVGYGIWTMSTGDISVGDLCREIATMTHISLSLVQKDTAAFIVDMMTHGLGLLDTIAPADSAGLDTGISDT